MNAIRVILELTMAALAVVGVIAFVVVAIDWVVPYGATKRFFAARAETCTLWRRVDANPDAYVFLPWPKWTITEQFIQEHRRGH